LKPLRRGKKNNPCRRICRSFRGDPGLEKYFFRLVNGERTALESQTKKDPSSLCHRFGTVAVRRGFISENQLKAAMVEQLEDDLNGRDHRIVGAILFKKGWITWDQVDAVLQELFKEGKEKNTTHGRPPKGGE
jgi:hypothetical protein